MTLWSYYVCPWDVLWGFEPLTKWCYWFNSLSLLGPLRVEEWQKQALDFDPLLSNSCVPNRVKIPRCVMSYIYRTSHINIPLLLLENIPLLLLEKNKVVILVASFSPLSHRYGHPDLPWEE